MKRYAQDEPPDKAAIEEMVRRLIELKRKLGMIKESVAEAEKNAREALGVDELSSKVEKEKPVLIEAVKGLEKTRIIVDGWVAQLSKRPMEHYAPGYKRKEFYEELLAKVEELAKFLLPHIEELNKKWEKIPDPTKVREEITLKEPKAMFIETSGLIDIWHNFRDWVKRELVPALEVGLETLDDIGKDFKELFKATAAFQKKAEKVTSHREYRGYSLEKMSGLSGEEQWVLSHPTQGIIDVYDTKEVARKEVDKLEDYGKF